MPQLPEGVRRAKARLRPLYRERTRRARSLPHFVIIGAQKAGTTSLIRYLRDHPDVLLEPGVGEVHFFDNHWERGEAFYRSHFPRTSRLQRHAQRTGRTTLTGEKTPYYLFHPLAPERAAKTIPDVKLIALLRNPAERAASHHKMNVNAGNETLSFAEAIDAESGRVEPALQGILEGRPVPECLPANLYSYVGRGRYAEQLDRWMQYYPREQLLVLRSEDLLTDPGPTYASILRFLDLAPHQPEFVRYNAARKPYTADPAVLEKLRERFDEPNRRLAEEYGISW